MVERVRVFWRSGDEDCELGLSAGESAKFGRGRECDIRFGHVPEADRSIPRVAGEVVVLERRIYLQSETIADRHPPLGLRRDDATLAFPDLAHGDGWSPDPGRNGFDVQVRGVVRAYNLQVECSYPPRVSAATSAGTLTQERIVLLTPRQLEAVELYAADGRADPASHAEVASAMNIESRTAIKHITDARDAFLGAGVPMPEYQQIARSVVEAYRTNSQLVRVRGRD